MCSGLRPLRPAGFIRARPYQSEGLAGGRYGALETALGRSSRRFMVGKLRTARPEGQEEVDQIEAVDDAVTVDILVLAAGDRRQIEA